jgi:hypothetical protein
MTLLLKLLLAHFLGDFLLQSSKWVKAKETHKVKAYQLYIHVLIHFALVMLLIWDWSFWPWATAIAASHLLIDSIKLYLQQQKYKRILFFADQLLHLLVLFIVWYYHQIHQLDTHSINLNYVLLWVTTLFFLTQPLSIAIKIFISKWTPSTEDKENDSLEDAGRYIGYLERLLVFTFIITNHWEAVGFLITAKSVFRFGDLKASKERKLTEYVLIGTLISFGTAISIALLFQFVLKII